MPSPLVSGRAFAVRSALSELQRAEARLAPSTLEATGRVVSVVGRYLAAHPEGTNPFELPFTEWIAECKDFRETSGRAGDVFLLHPYMLHTSSYNHRREARFMINPAAGFREPMRFDRRSDGSAYSPVEMAVLRGLGVDHLDFTPTSPRRMIVPPRVAMQEELRKQELSRLGSVGA